MTASTVVHCCHAPMEIARTRQDWVAFEAACSKSNKQPSSDVAVFEGSASRMIVSTVSHYQHVVVEIA